MKVGINILNFGPGTSPKTLLAWSRFAHETGFHLVMLSDHIAVTPQVQSGFPAPFYDPFLSLSWLAGQIDQLEIGTSVIILPYRHPLQTARLSANLDQLSASRFILGIGVGWAADEFDTLGIPFSKRGALTDEALEIIQLSWAQKEISYSGKFYSIDQVHTGPAPSVAEGPPIWVGGSSESALRRTVRYGTSWHPYRSPVQWLFYRALPRLNELAEKADKETPTLCPRISLRITSQPLPEAERILGRGTLEQIHSDLVMLAEFGCPYILLDTYRAGSDQTLNPEADWAILHQVADLALDLENQAVR